MKGNTFRQCETLDGLTILAKLEGNPATPPCAGIYFHRFTFWPERSAEEFPGCLSFDSRQATVIPKRPAKPGQPGVIFIKRNKIAFVVGLSISTERKSKPVICQAEQIRRGIDLAAIPIAVSI